ncbi:MAG: tetratricopeptide repeat protein, partial [Oscillospiraceae bacterium]|nr:tetratricopeptide repeat protein [Oscillospiraceae bacterium]
LIGALAVWFLIMPARTQRITQEADRKTSEYSSRAAEADARITELSQQMEISEETVNTANTQIETATAKTTAYESLIKAVNAYNNGDLDLASNALSSVDVSKLTAEGKAIYDDLVEKANGELLRGYKTEGISAYEEEDYQTAIECLEAAKAIDSSDYEVLSYLAHSYRMTGDTANADINFQLIINTYPDTVRADNARVYMSEEALAAAENGGGNQTENSDGGENEEEPTEGEGSGDGEDDYEEEYEEDYEG